MRAAADGARRRAGRAAPELARRVDVAEERPQDPLGDEHVGAAREPLAVVGARAGAAADQRIVDQLAERRGDRRPFAAGEVGAASPERAAGEHAGQLADEAPARLGREDHRRGAGRDLARAQLGERAAGGLEADRLRIAEAAGEARGAPVDAVALLAVGVVADRLDGEGDVRPARRAREPRRGGERRGADAASEDGAVGVGDPLVELERRRLAERGRAAAPRRRRATAPTRPTDRDRGARAPSPRAPAARPPDRAPRAPPARRSRARTAPSPPA